MTRSDTVQIRMASVADAPALLGIYAPTVVETPTSFELSPPTLDEYRSRIASIVAVHPWLVCRMDDRIVGFAYAGPHRTRPAYRWTVETTVYVEPAHQGRRVGTALYKTLFDLLRIQGFQTAYAGITLPNDASVALHLAFGFDPIGVYRAAGFKLGRWHDVAWYQRGVQERLSESPKPPLTPRAASGTRAWTEALGRYVPLIRIA